MASSHKTTVCGVHLLSDLMLSSSPLCLPLNKYSQSNLLIYLRKDEQLWTKQMKNREFSLMVGQTARYKRREKGMNLRAKPVSIL